ncbi:MAG: hypothetical protein QXV17_01600 [Candidatus Micrarchaeaceae archaeon]
MNNKTILNLLHKKWNVLVDSIYKAYSKSFKINFGKVVVLLYYTGVVKVLAVDVGYKNPAGSVIIASFKAKPGKKDDTNEKKAIKMASNQILKPYKEQLEDEIEDEEEHEYWANLIEKKRDALIKFINDLYPDTFDNEDDMIVVLNRNGKIEAISGRTTTTALMNGDAIEICRLESNIYYDEVGKEDYLYYIEDKGLESQYKKYVEDNDLDYDDAGYDFIAEIGKEKDFDRWLRQTDIDDFINRRVAEYYVDDAYDKQLYGGDDEED